MKNRPTYTYILFLLCLFMADCHAPSLATSEDDVVAVVTLYRTTKIMKSTIERRLEYMRRIYWHMPVTWGVAIEVSINLELTRQAAEYAGITISESDIDSRIRYYRYSSTAPLSEQVYIRHLLKSGNLMEWRQYRNELKMWILQAVYFEQISYGRNSEDIPNQEIERLRKMANIRIL